MTKPLSILHVYRSFDPRRGGPPVVALTLAGAQAARGHRVVALGLERPEQATPIRDLFQSIPHADHVRYVPVPARRFEMLASRHGVELMRANGPFDVVHLHALWAPLTVSLANACTADGTPYVLTPHGALYPYMLGQKALKKRLFLEAIFRRMINRAAAIHVLNEDEANAVRPLGLTAPLRIVPNGIDVDRIPAVEPGRFRGAHPELGERPYFVFVGRLHPMKGIDVLVDAIALLRDRGIECAMVVVGPDEGARADLERRIGAKRVADRVHLVGSLIGARKVEALRDAIGYAHAGRHETFSMAITEALALGLPTVISEHCHYPEVASEGCGRIVPLSASAFADAMGEVVASAPLRASMAEAGRRLVRERFTSQAVTDRMITLYRELADRTHSTVAAKPVAKSTRPS